MTFGVMMSCGLRRGGEGLYDFDMEANADSVFSRGQGRVLTTMGGSAEKRALAACEETFLLGFCPRHFKLIA
jgi:hypothetical protein